MPFGLIYLLIGILLASGGIGIGWWMRGISGENGGNSDKLIATQSLTKLHELAATVAANVGQHNSRVQKISENLSANDTQDTTEVVSAVAQLIEANETMQNQLDSAKERLQEQELLIKTHAADARTDPLTQLANRRAFDDELNRCLSDFQRSETPVSILMFDVDHFKEFNDTYGHQAGDEVLKGVAEVLKKSMCQEDTVSRFGGEEFAIILPNTSIDDGAPSAERARQAIEESTFDFQGQDLKVTTSVGAAQLLKNESIESVIQRSDAALYASKQAGRNQSCWHDGKEVRKLQESLYTEPDDTSSPEPQEEKKKSINERTDSDTGLSTHEFFCNDVNRRVADWSNGGSSVSVLLVEIDAFEQLQSQFGADASLKVLKITTQFLQATMREIDHAARYDTQTFGLLMPASNIEEAKLIGERLRHAISRCAIPLGSEQIQFTVSVGVAEIQEDNDAEQLLHRSEAALDEAVRKGRNSSYLHDGSQCVPISIDEAILA